MAPLNYQSPLGADPAWRTGTKGSYLAMGSLPSMPQHQPYYTSPFHRVQVPVTSRPCATSRTFTMTFTSFNNATFNRHPFVHLAVQIICFVCVLAVVFLLLCKLHARFHVRRVRLDDVEAPHPARILTRKGLKPGQLFSVPSMPVLLLPEGASFDMPREGRFLVPARD
ncbi:hypothetical protein BD289DRAFT_41946 [Coniella lustricola]|uniref:Uncharacterized protein n=1 Tax=Coniella lustricola TaxID=2025994 RepID=A0A2T3A1Y8_9PEZI|nr:hypothetical protein BD289DRAFT_41946 [Coniella lustricola]